MTDKNTTCFTTPLPSLYKSITTPKTVRLHYGHALQFLQCDTVQPLFRQLGDVILAVYAERRHCDPRSDRLRVRATAVPAFVSSADLL